MSDVTIEVKTNPRFRPMRMAYAAALQIGVIGVGVVTNSAAMQWAGFVVLALLVLGGLVISSKKNEGLSFNQARCRLDELEAKEE